jgi:exoribonuclease-2
MLPQEATTRLGMGLAEISPALSFGIDLSPEGEVVDLEIMTSWVRVTRMTYGEAQAQINSPPLSELMEVAQKYEALRRDGGAIQIDLPEVRVRVMGDQVEIEPLPKLASRDLVREAMLMTGEAVARFALEHKIPIPYTSQNPPDHILEQAKSPSEMFALRRSMQASRQSSAPAPHAGLGMALYVQTTSPLRRYLDLVVHQQLRAFLKGREPLDAQAVMERVGSAGAIRGSARWAERLSKRFWTLIYLMRNPGWQGKGIVVDKRGGRDIVLIPDLALDTEMYLREKIALDSLISLALNEVNLAQMTTHFRRL